MPRESESPLISHSHGREARIMYLVGSQRLRAAGVRPTHGLLSRLDSPRLPCATWLVARGARSPVRAGRVRSGEPERYVVSGFCLSFGSPLRGTVVRRRPFGPGVRWARAAAAALRALAAARPRWPRCVSTVFHQPRAGCTARNNDKRTNAGRARKSGQRSGFRSPRASRGRVAGGAGSRAVSQIAKRGQIEHKLQRPNEPRRHPTIRICCNHS